VAAPEPKEYQAKAITSIADSLSSLLSRDPGADRLVVFKAPTGSGKTLSTAYALNRTFERPGNPGFIVLWLSPGKGDLHKQSAKALDGFLANTSMEVVLLDTRDDERIKVEIRDAGWGGGDGQRGRPRQLEGALRRHHARRPIRQQLAHGRAARQGSTGACSRIGKMGRGV